MDSLEAQRRAIGTSMVSERTGKQVQQAINQLAARPTTSQGLKPLETKGKQDAKRGRGNYTEPAKTGTGGGIASPLVEKTKSVDGKAVPDREYWPGGLTSSDGLFILPSIKTLNLTDANGAAVQFQLADPAGTATDSAT
ncbi:hypothetical protein [Pseudomonas oryzihabitans]|uniref:hypothetical protein n=1 Tax=Pseudomonas oryzihabitans TaxID=47885 RepID=UPI0011A011C2|nr:hypothetical protein [Pseudomonas oryzihabitans]